MERAAMVFDVVEKLCERLNVIAEFGKQISNTSGNAVKAERWSARSPAVRVCRRT